jgi:hypothetical protein
VPAWEHTRLPVASKFDTFSVAGIHHKILVAVDAEVVYLTARAATAHTPRGHHIIVTRLLGTLLNPGKRLTRG